MYNKNTKQYKKDILEWEQGQIKNFPEGRLKTELLEMIEFQIKVVFLDTYFIKFCNRKIDRKIALYKAYKLDLLVSNAEEQKDLNNSILYYANEDINNYSKAKQGEDI